MIYRVLDPTSEESGKVTGLARRLITLRGTKVGLISNGKEGTNDFFAIVERLLYERFSVAEVISRVKANYSAPAAASIIDEVRNWNAVITGIGD
ncbi:MAG: hypothetical protein O2971_01830 [Proteobacteria bacterium]|nr:hypothetical protein [Pseudomonadota bacterium]